jgi:hypothetical protein
MAAVPVIAFVIDAMKKTVSIVIGTPPPRLRSPKAPS